MFEAHPDLLRDLTALLPPSLADNLSSEASVREALQHLNSLERAVTSFLPTYIAEDRNLFGENHTAVRDQGSLRAGVFLFADVSGFTALSERLQQHSGAAGTEVLTAIINRYFETMLDVLAKSEGQLLKFAGDALLAFFPTEPSGTFDAPALKAVRTGLRMQRAMKARFQPIRDDELARLFGSDHGAQLTMSIGIAEGHLFEALVGNSQQRDHIIQGDLPGRAMEAEGVGERDEVIVTPEIASLLGDQFRYQPLADDFMQVVDDLGDLDDFETTLLQVRRRQGVAAGLFDLEQDNLLNSLARQVAKVRRVALFVPPPVLSGLINSDELHLPRENRYTATMFVHANGFADLLDAWGADELPRVVDLLGRYYSLVQRIVAQYGGTLARTDPYKRGFKLLCTFGAPIQHADDAYRAVSTAVELNYTLAQFNLRIADELPNALRRDHYLEQRIGITLGDTFTGEAGWKQRREFTVMGDDVNLAARLMAFASFGQILISERIFAQTRDSFHADALPPIQLKGKRSPVQAYAVSANLEATGFAATTGEIPFIGHELFMLKLDLLLQQAKFGRVKALALVGEAGIGKTRISRQFAENARAARFTTAWVTCQPRSRRSPWATLIAQLLNVDLTAPQTAKAQFETAMADPRWANLRKPLSGLLFGSGTQGPLSSPSPAQPADARPALNDMLAAIQRMTPAELKSSGMFGFMRRKVESQESVLVSAGSVYQAAEQRTSVSQAVVGFITEFARSTPIVLVIDDLHDAGDEALDILRAVLAQVTRAQLVILANFEPLSVDLDMKREIVPDLGRDETTRVGLAVLHVTQLDDRLEQLLWERTSGRPLYIESLLEMLQRQNFVSVDKGVARLVSESATSALPDDIRQLVVSRVDQLSPNSQQVIRIAAVLGEEFSVAALQAVAEHLSLEDVEAALVELVEAQILQPGEEGIYRFRHGMTQSVIHETLSRAQRVRLHQSAAAYYRRADNADASPIQAAFHMARNGLQLQAVEWLSTSADASHAAGQPAEALAYLRYALSLEPGDEAIRQRIEHLLGEPDTV